jgi:hypothetical protein
MRIKGNRIFDYYYVANKYLIHNNNKDLNLY